MGDIRYKAAVLFVENIFLLAREEEVGECIADLIGNIGEVEGLFLAVVASDNDSLQRLRGCGNGLAPREVGLLVAWHCDEALEGQVFIK